MHTRHVGSPQALSRREMLRAGGIGLMGLGLADLSALRAQANSLPQQATPDMSVIFIFLTGGISHQDTFDMKPFAPDGVRSEFQPVASKVPGISISEHLPLLAQRTDRFAQVRSMTTNSNGHEEACHMLLTGRLDFPLGFSTARVPSPNEWPSLLSQVMYATRGRHNLPASLVLPEPSVNEAASVRPGQYAGRLGPTWESWHVDIAAKCPLGNGACPDCFRFDDSKFEHSAQTIFDTPMLTLPEGGKLRFNGRIGLLAEIERQRRDLERIAEVGKLDKYRHQAVQVLADPKTSAAFDVEHADPQLLARYGKNKFGLSCLMALRLADAGVNLVQVNLGKNSSWDTHQANFRNLKKNLLPHFDRCISALLDDLYDSGLHERTLVVVTGEFGRTPKINKDAGRDHWGPVWTQLYFGGGVTGGQIIGQTDDLAAYPTRDKLTTENFAATLFQTLGIPRTAEWLDFDGRPHTMYRAEPIPGLT